VDLDLCSSNVQDAFVIAVEQQARERLEKLSALKRITPIDMNKLSQQEIYEQMLIVYKDSCPSIITVEKLVAKLGVVVEALMTIHVKDAQKEKRPTPEIVEKTQAMVLETRRITESDLVESL
uniref:Uncharacterized protein LOC114348031 n=1 Tax=Diabrotica virgifera virgifera TaxID=50390 RepID=A0A6P7H7C6_DIAVI